MNETQAKAALKRLYGRKAGWRYNDKALKAEDREALGATLPGLATAARDAKAAADARRAELLKDPEYLRLREAERQAHDLHSKAAGRYHSRRVTVGYITDAAGLSMFTVEGEGDNWQDAIDAARAKRGAK